MSCTKDQHHFVKVGECTHSSASGSVDYRVYECSECGVMGHKPLIFMDFSKRLTRKQLAERLEREDRECPIEQRKRQKRGGF